MIRHLVAAAFLPTHVDDGLIGRRLAAVARTTRHGSIRRTQICRFAGAPRKTSRGRRPWRRGCLVADRRRRSRVRHLAGRRRGEPRRTASRAGRGSATASASGPWAHRANAALARAMVRTFLVEAFDRDERAPPVAVPPAGRRTDAHRARQTQHGFAQSGDRRHARLRVVQHRTAGRARHGGRARLAASPRARDRAVRDQLGTFQFADAVRRHADPAVRSRRRRRICSRSTPRPGSERWKADRGRGRQSYSTPFVVRTDTGPELIVNSSQRIDAYDPRTRHAVVARRRVESVPNPVARRSATVCCSSRAATGAARTWPCGQVDAATSVPHMWSGSRRPARPTCRRSSTADGLVYMADRRRRRNVLDARPERACGSSASRACSRRRPSPATARCTSCPNPARSSSSAAAGSRRFSRRTSSENGSSRRPPLPAAGSSCSSDDRLFAIGRP